MSELVVNQVDVAKLKVQPGEMLVVTVKMPLTMEMAARVKEAFTKAFKEGGGYVPSILVIDDKIEARVMTAEQVGATP